MASDLPATIAEIERLMKDRDAKAALLESSGASPANDPDDHYENWVKAAREWRIAIEANAPVLLQAAREREELLQAALAYRALGTCYRLGERPSERLFKKLNKASLLLDRITAPPAADGKASEGGNDG